MNETALNEDTLSEVVTDSAESIVGRWSKALAGEIAPGLRSMGKQSAGPEDEGHWISADCWALDSAPKNMPARMAMMTIVTSNSISVKPRRRDMGPEFKAQGWGHVFHTVPSFGKGCANR